MSWNVNLAKKLSDVQKRAIYAALKKAGFTLLPAVLISFVLQYFKLAAQDTLGATIGSMWVLINGLLGLYFREEKRIEDIQGHGKTHDTLNSLIEAIRDLRGDEKPSMAPIAPPIASEDKK